MPSVVTPPAGNGFNQPMSVAVAPDGDTVRPQAEATSSGFGGMPSDNKRIGKLTIDEEFIGDFGRNGSELTWPAGPRH